MQKDGIETKGRAAGKRLTLFIEVEFGEVGEGEPVVVAAVLLGIEVHDAIASKGFLAPTPYWLALLRKAERIVQLVTSQPLRRRRSLGLGHA